MVILNDPDLQGIFDEKILEKIIVEENIDEFVIKDIQFTESHLLIVQTNHHMLEINEMLVNEVINDDIIIIMA